MELRPTDIYYSQDSIMNRFGDYTAHGGTYIGETLDQLLSGHCNVNNIPNITVVKRNDKWFTSDNRRLWVFRKAEELGFLDMIEVNVSYYLNQDKFTTENGGTSIRVRGRNPGGSLWKTLRPKRQNSGFGRPMHNMNRNDSISPRTTRTTTPVTEETTNFYNKTFTTNTTRSFISPTQDHFSNNTTFNDRIMSPSTTFTQPRHSYTENAHPAWQQDRIASPSFRSDRSYPERNERKGCCIIL